MKRSLDSLRGAIPRIKNDGSNSFRKENVADRWASVSDNFSTYRRQVNMKDDLIRIYRKLINIQITEVQDFYHHLAPPVILENQTERRRESLESQRTRAEIDAKQNAERQHSKAMFEKEKATPKDTQAADKHPESTVINITVQVRPGISKTLMGVQLLPEHSCASGGMNTKKMDEKSNTTTDVAIKAPVSLDPNNRFQNPRGSSGDDTELDKLAKSARQSFAIIELWQNQKSCVYSIL